MHVFRECLAILSQIIVMITSIDNNECFYYVLNKSVVSFESGDFRTNDYSAVMGDSSHEFI